MTIHQWGIRRVVRERCVDIVLQLSAGLTQTMPRSMGAREEVDRPLCLKGTWNSAAYEASLRQWGAEASLERRRRRRVGGLNLQCKPTQVSGGRAPWSLHHENHLNGQRRGRVGAEIGQKGKVWPVCYGSFSDTVTKVIAPRQEELNTSIYLVATQYLQEYLPKICGLSHWTCCQTCLQQYAVMYCSFWLPAVVMLQALHRGTLTRCKYVSKTAEVATLQGVAG